MASSKMAVSLFLLRFCPTMLNVGFLDPEAITAQSSTMGSIGSGDSGQ